MPEKRKPILCLDFDGVIHSYTSGWTGAHDVADPPVPGALTFIQEAQQDFDVCIFSSRSGQPNGIGAMKTWLRLHYQEYFQKAGVPGDQAFIRSKKAVKRIDFPTEKPPAFVTIDDRAVQFEGAWPAIEDLLSFKPWNKREEKTP
ncbi:hypothetical protein [Hoeflea poritis]|uniref:Polynucleotide kinase n=1 Tax=Hoeflea poritis TaxID=2993659 RepID=A0ABT4VPJ5_9HYPH|nr:hypothetical protein [Hoeflea poritis]MDA4845933.1 hypothetical protein [Hoeflea poritis]